MFSYATNLKSFVFSLESPQTFLFDVSISKPFAKKKQLTAQIYG